MLNRLPIRLSSLYLDKKIETETFTKLMTESHHSVFMRMYCIANGIKERQEFLELETTENIRLVAAVTTIPALTGEAKEQFRVTKFRNKFNRSPYYIVRVILSDLNSGKDLIDFKHKTSNEEEVYNLLPVLEDKINKTQWNKVD